MARRSRKRPSSPAEILARSALERGQRRAADRSTRSTPGAWGLPEGVEHLPANEDMVVVRDGGRRGRVLHARRSDAFSLVSMSADQERAAARYVRDWMIRVGTNVDDETFLQLVVDTSSGLAPGQGTSQRMIDAGKRIEDLHAEVGRGSARLLAALVEPLAVHGEIRVWRVVVEKVTGETERHAQAAAVRLACQALHLAYEDLDEIWARERKDRKDRQEDAARFAGGGSIA